MLHRFTLALTSTFMLALTCSPLSAAKPKIKMTLPDFTKGDSIPKGADHDWNLGATGARGWIYTEGMETSTARQIAITNVAKGSPASNLLKKGDIILGVSGKPFSSDPRTEFGKALTLAESTVGKGTLALTRWRTGTTKEVTLRLPVLGDYSATAPYDCPKSALIFTQGCDALAKKMQQKNYNPPPIPRSLNALALLASGDAQYLPLIKKEVAWASKFKVESMATWYYGYATMLVAEYTIATGDQTYLSGLRRLAIEASDGQSLVGSWGHKFAGPDDRLFGYGMMNAPGLTMTTGLVLATKAGISDPKVARAIEKSTRMLRFYAGKGAIPYGDHTPWVLTHEDNGKCGAAAVLFSLNNEPKVAEFFSRLSIASHSSERDNGHTGNYLNILWSIPSVAQSGQHATGAWMQEFGSWYFDLARTHTGAFAHQGQPQATNEKFYGWDASGAYLLSYARSLKKLYLTGKEPSKAPQLNPREVSDIISDGRGWSNNHPYDTYDKLSEADLLALLSRWSPIVRERAAISLARKKSGDPVPTLIKMLASPDLDTRYGACQALALLKKKSAPAVPALQKNLKHPDLWLRVKAAEAIAQTGPAGMVALPEILTIIARGATKADPRAMEQRYLNFVVFGKMVKNPLKDVDPALLQKAIIAGLTNEDGSARGAVSDIYNRLSYEEIKPLLPAIRDAIINPAQSGVMFAGKVRLAGAAILAKHRIKEGMELTFVAMDVNKWGKGSRIPRSLNTLEKYGSAAKPMIPKLRELEALFNTYKPSDNTRKYIAQIHKVIKTIETSTKKIELRSIE